MDSSMTKKMTTRYAHRTRTCLMLHVENVPDMGEEVVSW